MSQLFPIQGSGAPGQSDPEPTHRLDPRLEREEVRRRWILRAAEFRALALAEAIFGEGVSPTLAASGPGQAFRGILTLEVPFRSLEDHRAREMMFMACVSRDEVTSRVPYIYVFSPLVVAP